MTIADQMCNSCHSNVKILLLKSDINKYVCTTCYCIKKSKSFETISIFKRLLNN